MTAPVRLLALPRGVRPDSFAAEDVRKALRALARYAAYQDPQRKLAKGTVPNTSSAAPPSTPASPPIAKTSARSTIG